MKSGKRIIRKNINESVNKGLKNANKTQVTDQADSTATTVNKKMFLTMLQWNYSSLIYDNVMMIGGNKVFDGKQIESQIGEFEIISYQSESNPNIVKRKTCTLHMIMLDKDNPKNVIFDFQPIQYSPYGIKKSWDEMEYDDLERICKVIYPIYTNLNNRYKAKITKAKELLKSTEFMDNIKSEYGDYGLDIAKAILQNYDKNNLLSGYSVNLKYDGLTGKEILNLVYRDKLFPKTKEKIFSVYVEKIHLKESGQIMIDCKKKESRYTSFENLNNFTDDTKALIVMKITGNYPMDLKEGSVAFEQILNFVKKIGKWDWQGETPDTKVVYFVKKREKVDDVYAYIRFKPEDDMYGKVFAIAYENTHLKETLNVWYDNKVRSGSYKKYHIHERWCDVSWFTRKQIYDIVTTCDVHIPENNK